MKILFLLPQATLQCLFYPVFFMFILFTAPVIKASDLNIDYNAGKLSADITKAPMQNVLTLLAAKLDIPVFLDKTLKAKKVSVKFEGLEVEEGVKKLVHPYSTAIIFGKKKTTDGKSTFFISRLNVYNSSNKDPAYLAVGEMKQEIKDRKGKMATSGKTDMTREIPEERRDPEKSAQLNKKISSSILKSKISRKTASIRKLQQKITDQEQKKTDRIQELEKRLSSADEQEKYEIQSKLSILRSDLNNSKQKDAQELKKQQMELEQMKKKIRNYEQAQAEK